MQKVINGGFLIMKDYNSFNGLTFEKNSSIGDLIDFTHMAVQSSYH